MRSVIDQEGVTVEYIVVDAGSTDGSREIIERYREKVACIILEPDRGPADGLNKGFAAATGNVFGFLNSDDYLLPTALLRVQDFILKNPDVDVVSGHALIVDGEGKVCRRSYSDRFSARMHALGASVLMQQSTFFKARAFRETGGFNIENRIAWDGELFYRMYREGAKFALTNEFLSAFRIHDAGITGSARLDLAWREYCAWVFRDYYGRTPGLFDRFLMSGARIVKHLRNWRDSRERLLHGAVYGRNRAS